MFRYNLVNAGDKGMITRLLSSLKHFEMLFNINYIIGWIILSKCYGFNDYILSRYFQIIRILDRVQQGSTKHIKRKIKYPDKTLKVVLLLCTYYLSDMLSYKPLWRYFLNKITHFLVKTQSKFTKIPYSSAQCYVLL